MKSLRIESDPFLEDTFILTIIHGHYYLFCPHPHKDPAWLESAASFLEPILVDSRPAQRVPGLTATF